MATLGSSPSFNQWHFIGSGGQNQAYSDIYTMPQNGWVTSIVFYANAESGTTNFIGCVWDASGNLLCNGTTCSPGAGSNSIGGQSWQTSAVTPFWLGSGQQIRIGWTRPSTQTMLWSSNSGAFGGIASGGDPGNIGGSQANYGQIGAYINYTPQGDMTASTGSASSITATTATLNGSVTDNFYSVNSGVNAASSIDFNLNTTPSSSGQTPETASPSSYTGSASASSNVTGLTPNTTYYFQIANFNSHISAFGSWVSFTTNGQPNAPTLTAPANNTYATLSTSGETFTWTYNSGGAAGGQTGYSLKVTGYVPGQTGTGPWYWTGSAWSATQTWVSTATASVTIGASNWLANEVYTWTVANEDAGGQGPFASALTLNGEGPPNAPTLTSPAGGTYEDMSGTPSFAWTYSPNIETGGQTGWQFRRKVSGGAYQYWNGGSSSWQSSVFTNSGSVTSYTFPSGAWVNGNTYNWSVASVDAGGTGPFATDLSIVAEAPPSVTVTAPSGATISQTPLVQWSDTLPSGAVQTSYQIRTFSSAQYGAGGFSPSTSTPTDDSGVVNSATTNYQLATTLANGTAYRSYANITETGGLTNNWSAFGAYTVTLDTPPTPTITATSGTDPATGCPRINLVVTSNCNLLSAVDASFETGVGTWTATNAAVAQSTTHALDGTYSLKATPSAAGAVTAVTGYYAVQPSTQYTAVISDYSGLAAETVKANISWYNSSHTLISSSNGTGVTDSTSAWTQATVTATAPSNAAYATVWFSYTATGTTDVKYLDECGLFLGTNTTWSAGGFLTTGGIVILRSDGLYVRLASATNPYPINSSTQSETIYDYETVPGTGYTYQALVQATVSGSTVQSSYSTGAGASIATGLGFWELDPTNPSSAINAQPTQWNISATEQSSSHQVLGQTTMNVVAYAMQGTDVNATFETFTSAIYTGLWSLVTGQKPVFVSDPYGYGWYFRLAPQPGGMSSGSGNKAHDTQLMGSTAAAPHRVIAVTGIAAPRPAV